MKTNKRIDGSFEGLLKEKYSVKWNEHKYQYIDYDHPDYVPSYDVRENELVGIMVSELMEKQRSLDIYWNRRSEIQIEVFDLVGFWQGKSMYEALKKAVEEIEWGS